MNTRRMEHDKKPIRSLLMILTPLLATTAIAATRQLPMGALDSEEKYAEFWSEIVETDFEMGACAFSLGSIASANSNYIIRAIDTRLEDSEPSRVGEFTMHRQDVAHTFEPVTYSYADDHLVHILINHMTLMQVEQPMARFCCSGLAFLPPRLPKHHPLLGQLCGRSSAIHQQRFQVRRHRFTQHRNDANNLGAPTALLQTKWLEEMCVAGT